MVMLVWPSRRATMWTGRPSVTASVVNSRRKSCGMYPQWLLGGVDHGVPVENGGDQVIDGVGAWGLPSCADAPSVAKRP
ncbi:MULTISPECIES: hypothetical protein [Amycolatopsis]|uniref:hypothetical protein n=1 Tax=Amycolatopsis TaxID=1813 RepID=UPI002104C714|nr:hypothetical protein [Amycolatopsis sp. TNS106]